MNTQTDSVQTLADHSAASDHYQDFSGLTPYVFIAIIATLLAVGLPTVLGVVAMTVRP